MPRPAGSDPRVLVIQPDADTPLGVIGPRLAAAGIEVEIWAPRAGSAPAGPFAGVIVLGSVANPDEDRLEQWIGGVRGEVSLALQLGLPILGICFGAQVVAQSLGGTATRMPAAEIGWVRMTPSAGASGDPLFGSMPADGAEFLSWHEYEMELPAGARRLVEPTVCEQAFRLEGTDVWAVQFHFEAGASIADEWTDSEPDGLAALGVSAAGLRAATRVHAPVALPVAEAIADGFARVVRDRSSGK